MYLRSESIALLGSLRGEALAVQGARVPSAVAHAVGSCGCFSHQFSIVAFDYLLEVRHTAVAYFYGVAVADFVQS